MITHSKPTIENDDIQAVIKQLESRMIVKGSANKKFENALTKYFNTLHTITTSSGKSALIKALLLFDIKSNDEVILPTYICRTVYDAVKFTGAKPVIVDINYDYNISLEEIEDKINSKTKVIIAVHIFGISVKMDEIIDIAKKNDVIVIEDIAQSFGGVYKNQKLGSFGELGFGSFHATKLLTTGEGGFLLINNEKLLNKFKKIKHIIDFGANLSDFNASIGINQLKKFDRFLKKRKQLAKEYFKNLSSSEKIELPITDFKKSIFFRFPIRIKNDFSFNELRNKMDSEGIQIRKGVDLMLHQIDNNISCPNADILFNQTVSLPVYPDLKIEDINYICNKLKKYI